MERPSYLSKYLFNWELFEVVVGGQSALDSRFFVGQMLAESEVHEFLRGYGLDSSDPVVTAELFGNFQEALQFIRRFFLIDGNPEGVDLKIPESILTITEVSQLFLMSSGSEQYSQEEKLWAEVVLKVMHTILHADKDLRSNYFSVIQTQIFDKFYKHIFRDEADQLFLGDPSEQESIPLLEFETKSKKTRESIIIKLLHKVENVAEEVFDRIGVRFVTNSGVDTLRTINYLVQKNIVIPHNIKPSRSLNTMFNLKKYKKLHQDCIKRAIRNGESEAAFQENLIKNLESCRYSGLSEHNNKHSLKSYSSIQFTSRQLVKYRNPFIEQFSAVRKLAKSQSDSLLAKKVLSMDYSLVSRDIRFFYPFEVQVVDKKAQIENTEGMASHAEYKKKQILSAMKRLFTPLLDYKNIKIDDPLS